MQGAPVCIEWEATDTRLPISIDRWGGGVRSKGQKVSNIEIAQRLGCYTSKATHRESGQMVVRAKLKKVCLGGVEVAAWVGGEAQPGGGYYRGLRSCLARW